MLRLVLCIGNELNASVASLAGARGFRVLDLQKLKSVTDCLAAGAATATTSTSQAAAKPIAHSLLAFTVRLLSGGVRPLKACSLFASASETVVQPLQPVSLMGANNSPVGAGSLSSPTSPTGDILAALVGLKDSVHQACKIDIAALAADVAELRSHLVMCQSYCKTNDASTCESSAHLDRTGCDATAGTLAIPSPECVVSANGPFLEFVETADPVVQGLEEQLLEAQSLLRDLMLYCGEGGPAGHCNGAPVQPSDVFAALGQFVLDVESCISACAVTV
jgi:hypothetical protein